MNKAVLALDIYKSLSTCLGTEATWESYIEMLQTEMDKGRNYIELDMLLKDISHLTYMHYEVSRLWQSFKGEVGTELQAKGQDLNYLQSIKEWHVLNAETGGVEGNLTRMRESNFFDKE